jgi:hypothetical protein
LALWLELRALCRLLRLEFLLDGVRDSLGQRDALEQDGLDDETSFGREFHHAPADFHLDLSSGALSPWMC